MKVISADVSQVSGNCYQVTGELELRLPVQDNVYYTNLNSVNLIAEALGELMSPTEYARTVKVELSHIGIDSCGITLKDASGLSPANAVPAEVFTDLLIWAKGHISDAIVAPFPQEKVD